MEIKEAIDRIHTKILRSKVAEEITESEIEVLVELKQKLNNGYTFCKVDEVIKNIEYMSFERIEKDEFGYLGMQYKNPCIICENYSKGKRCDMSADCPIQHMKDENQRLKKENRALKKIIGKLELKMSYMRPIDIIGGKKEMGW